MPDVQAALTKRLAHEWTNERMDGRYLPVCQIDLVPQHHHGVGRLPRKDFGQNLTPPGVQGFEGLQVSDIESQDAAVRALVERGHYGAEPLLSTRVPDLRGRAEVSVMSGLLSRVGSGQPGALCMWSSPMWTP